MLMCSIKFAIKALITIRGFSNVPDILRGKECRSETKILGRNSCLEGRRKAVLRLRYNSSPPGRVSRPLTQML
jgi:hypothetical protein